MTGVSIAMATYNGERFIVAQLASLAAQTRPPDELVVCDDGSTDATVEIVDRFAGQAPFPVRVFRNPKNLGYADNFLTAAGLCSSEWVAFCDQDDTWAPDKLERVAEVIDRRPEVLLVSHPAYLTEEDGTPTGEVAWPSRERFYRPGTFNPWRSGMGCGQVFRAFLVREIPWDRRFMKDPQQPSTVSPHDDWVLKISQCLGGAYYMETPLVYRRRHAGSVTAERGPPTRLARPALRREGIVAELERYAALARNRAEVLEDCAGRCAPTHRQPLLACARYFSDAAAVLERRAAWRRKAGLARATGALGLMVSPAYRRMGAGVAGLRGLARDLADLPSSAGVRP